MLSSPLLRPGVVIGQLHSRHGFAFRCGQWVGQIPYGGGAVILPLLGGQDSGSGFRQEATSERAAQAADPNNPVGTDRWCSIPRNDVKALPLQPTANQVEWAVNLAIRGELRSKYMDRAIREFEGQASR